MDARVLRCDEGRPKAYKAIPAIQMSRPISLPRRMKSLIEPITPQGWRRYKIAFSISLVGSIILGLLWWEHEDYSVYYPIFWNSFLEGHLTFVYPIGFLVFFSGLFRINYLLPKLVFLIFHVITSYQIFRLLSKREDFGKRELFSCTYYLFNPFLCVSSIYTGLFDTVIGFLVLNLVLLLESKKGNQFLKDAIALLLIGLIISIKFVGLVIMIPYLITGRKTMLRRVILTVGGVLLVFGVLTLMHVQITALIQPFLTHAERTMYSIFAVFGVEPPLFIAVFIDFYSQIAVVVTAIALVSFDLLFFIKKFGFRLRVLLDIMVFLTFFQVTNAQFIIWYIPLFVLVYNEYSPTKKEMFNKMALHQGFMVSLGFLSPFAQFLNLFFISDIYKEEIKSAKYAGLASNLTEEGVRISG
jgi:hypothetical protein